MQLKIFLLSVFCLFAAQTAGALTDRHLIIIQPGDTELTYLSTKGREQVKQMADRLLAHGFDNRSISAVYASTAKSALETCQILSDIGVFSTDKIRMDPRLGEGDEHLEILMLYDEAENNHPKGHLVFVMQEPASMKLLEGLTQSTVKLANAQPYIMPLAQRSVHHLISKGPE